MFPLLEPNGSPRDLETCPVQVLENIPDGYWPDQSIKNVEIDFTKLESILSPVSHTEACLILTKDWLKIVCRLHGVAIDFYNDLYM